MLIRHGRTDWNDVSRFQGRSDIPLNDTGRLQAEKTAARLAKWPIDAVYTSPLIRAAHTAEMIAAPHQKQIISLEGLTETNFGVWEGQRYGEIKQQNPSLMKAWLDDPFFNMPDKAETWEDIRVRAEHALGAILRSQYERIAVISHGGIMRALFAVLLKFDPHTVWNIKTSNCALNGVEIGEDQNSLVFSNDNFHLRAGFEGSALPVW